MKYIILLLLSCSLSFSFTLDKKYDYDDNEFWASHYDVPWQMGSIVSAIALIEGTNSRVGRTAIKSFDSFLISSVAVQSLKYATGRVRPRSTENPNDWFEFGNMSFLSGHVSSVTSFVTPFIIEYKDDKPWIYALTFFPIHQMVGRIKDQAHWSSDVIFGALLGVASGYLAYYKTPIVLSFSDDHKYIGLAYRF